MPVRLHYTLVSSITVQGLCKSRFEPVMVSGLCAGGLHCQFMCSSANSSAFKPKSYNFARSLYETLSYMCDVLVEALLHL